MYIVSDFERIIFNIDNVVYANDNSIVSLCLKVCPWAKYRKNKGGVKMY